MALNAATTWLPTDEDFHPLGERQKLMNPKIGTIYKTYVVIQIIDSIW
jgi:hypothetical protein